MARQLTFEIVAQTYEAEAKLRVLEQQIADLNTAVRKGDITWEEYEKQLKQTSGAAAAAKQNLQGVTENIDVQTDKTKALTDKTGALSSAVMRYASFAVVGAAVKSTIDWAGKLNDLASRSGIGVVQLQKLASVAEASGGSLDDVANASAQVLDKLGSKDKNLLKAVKELGLDFRTLSNQDPGQTFIDLASAVAKVEDPAKRMALAVDVFGKQGRTLMPTIMEIGKGLGDIATASPETIEELDTLGDMFGNLWGSGKIVLAELIAPFAPALTALGEAAIWAAHKLGAMLGWLVKYGASGPLGKVKEWFGTAQTLAEWWKNAPQTAPELPKAPALAMNEPFGVPTLAVGTADYQTVVKDLTDKAAATRKKKELALLASKDAARLNYLALGLSIPELPTSKEGVFPVLRARPEPQVSLEG